MLVRLFEEHALEIVGNPEWRVSGWEDLSREGFDGMAIEGMVCPLISKGKRKGRPNYRRGDRTTIRKIYISKSDHEKWLVAYTAKTGNCDYCSGEGQIMVSWHHITGRKDKQCPICGGTGKLTKASLK